MERARPHLAHGRLPQPLRHESPTCSSRPEEIGPFVASAIEPITRLPSRVRPRRATSIRLVLASTDYTSMIPTQRLIAVSSLYIAFASRHHSLGDLREVPTVNFDVWLPLVQTFRCDVHRCRPASRTSCLRCLAPRLTAKQKQLSSSEVTGHSARWKIDARHPDLSCTN